MWLIYRMLAFIAPTIWRTLVTIPFNGPLATLPQSLVLGPILPTAPPPRTPPNAFNYRAFVVVRDGTTPIVVLDFHILLMTPHAMKLWRRVQIHKEIRYGRERGMRQVMFRSGRCCRVGRRSEFGEGVLVESFGGDGGD